MWFTIDMYFKVIDRYNEQLVSAYVTPSSMQNCLSLCLKPTQISCRQVAVELTTATIAFLWDAAYQPASDYRFLLLHDGRHEEGVKAFFTELHELLTKATLNPLYVDG